MNRHDIEKKAMEKEALDWFLEQYNILTNQDFWLLYQQESPDALIEATDGTKLGVEVTHLFYDALEAKILLGRSKDDVHGAETFTMLVNQLNQLLQKKAEVGSHYHCPLPVILIIRCYSTVFTGRDFEDIHQKISVPKGIYYQIWLLVRGEMGEGWPYLIRLD